MEPDAALGCSRQLGCAPALPSRLPGPAAAAAGPCTGTPDARRLSICLHCLPAVHVQDAVAAVAELPGLEAILVNWCGVLLCCARYVFINCLSSAILLAERFPWGPGGQAHQYMMRPPCAPLCTPTPTSLVQLLPRGGDSGAAHAEGQCAARCACGRLRQRLCHRHIRVAGGRQQLWRCCHAATRRV